MNIEETTHKLGIELNNMQQASANAILHSKDDVVILSPTGSGKTLAYLLPLLQLLNPNSNDVQAVVLVPGRELALQTEQVMKSAATGLRSMALYGGRPTMDEHRMMRKLMPQIVFATPGRINDHLLKHNIEADSVKWLVIDEFDKCLEMGFLNEMSEVLARLPEVERRILLSATDAGEIPQFVNMGHTKHIDFSSGEEQLLMRIAAFTVMSEQKDKLPTLCRLLRYLGTQRSIIFLNHRDAVERAASYLQEQGFVPSLFHGGLDQRQREDAIYKFSNDSANILVCTDLASRGLDMPDVQNVIHYHLPETQEAYVHRMGRTARWDKGGCVYYLLNSADKLPDYVDPQPTELTLPDQLQQPALPEMATIYIGKGKKDKISRGDVVGFLCKKARINATDVGRIDVKERYAYAAVKRDKVAQVIKLASGEKIKGVRTIVEEVR